MKPLLPTPPPHKKKKRKKKEGFEVGLMGGGGKG